MRRFMCVLSTLLGMTSLGSVPLKGGYILQQAKVQTVDTSGPITSHISDCFDTTALICNNGTGSILANITAVFPPVGSTEFSQFARAAVGRAGSVGLSVQNFSAQGPATAEVDITSTEFVNVTSLPQRILSNVIIDGGMLQMNGASFNTIEYA